MKNQKTNVLIVGATGYLGKHLISACADAGYSVRALARSPERLSNIRDELDDIFIGEATSPASLKGSCDGIDIVISALGITRQKDGLTYDQVDYGANHNVLNEALLSGVKHFAYVHVLNAEDMPAVAMARAKAKFAAELAAAPIKSTIIRPSGFFSDLMEILDMAMAGRVYLFGNGKMKISPIDGADLAALCIAAIAAEKDNLEAGGPDALTHNQIAHLAFEALEKPARITHVPLFLGKIAIFFANLMGMKSLAGPIEFFVRASELDMSASPFGKRTLSAAFREKIEAHKPNLRR